jgi:hypothetical protein
MKFRTMMLAVAASALGLVGLMGVAAPAHASSVTPGYSPLPQVMYQLSADQPCLKGRGTSTCSRRPLATCGRAPC